MKWYKRNPALFDRDTRKLTLAQRGAYDRLVDEYYLTEKPLKLDDADLASICRCTVDEWLAVKPAVLKYFRADGDVLRHDKCDNVMADYERCADASRENGKKGGRPPKGEKTREKTDRNPVGLTQGAKKKPEREIEKKIQNPPDPPSGGGPDGVNTAYLKRRFEEWWPTYPHRVEEADAFEAFAAVLTGGGVTVEELIDGARRYAETKPADINWLKPAKWLRRGRWKDEPAPAKDSPAPDHDTAKRREAERERFVPPVNDDRWARVLNCLHGEFGDAAWRNWLRLITFHGENDGVLLLSAQTKFKRDYIAREYAIRILALWRHETGGRTETMKIEVIPAAAARTLQAVKAEGLLPGAGNGAAQAAAEPDAGAGAEADTVAAAPPSPAPDDAELDIPAFLRRQAN